VDRRTMMIGVVTGAVGSMTRTFASAQLQGGPAADKVADAERAFAASMAKRDLAAFQALVSEDAVFIGGGAAAPRISRGRAAVVDWWKQFFTASQAPFSWEPDLVEVIDAGTLALTSGPVRDPSGKVTGRFNSIWRLESDGRWRVVFDKGQPVCA